MAQKALDVYARLFVPYVLVEANETPASIISSSEPPQINFQQYTSTFSGSFFLNSTSAKDGHSPPKIRTPSHPLASDQEVDLLNYSDWFDHALSLEMISSQQECDEHSLYDTRLTQDPNRQTFRLSVPGLRETSLRVDVGDIVEIRQLRENPQGEVVAKPALTDPQGRSLAVGNNDRQYNARVWAVDRLHEVLHLRLDGLTPRSLRFNVRFTVQVERLHTMRLNVHDLAAQLAKGDDSWVRSMLFPKNSDGIMQRALSSLNHGLNLYDPLLNREQSRAVRTILEDNYGQVPYLIFGPPGTGKTKTVVEVVLQMVSKDVNARILLCAPSDPAADILVQRLSRNTRPQDTFRLNSSFRSFPEVPASVLPFCHSENGIFALPPFHDLMQKRIVVATCRDTHMFQRARVTNQDLYTLETNLHKTLHPSQPISPDLHWTALIIDEAAQAMEPEAAIPLQVIAPPTNFDVGERRAPAVVLIGDENQLGPRTVCKDRSLQQSLFERLLERPLYCQHPLARSKLSGGSVATLSASVLPIIRPPFMNLIRNYRSHRAILAVPSSLFYFDTLESCASNADLLLPWFRLRGTQLPVLFCANRGADEIEKLDGGGWYNHDEVVMALSTARSVLHERLLAPEDICIMSPFRAQVRLLRHKARHPHWALGNVNIGPLEAFQGLESRLVILCTTRTRDRFIDQDISRGNGLIHESRRFNVALTRAKEGLVVIGHPSILGQDENWASFMAFCKRNGCFKDNETDLEDHVFDWETVYQDRIRLTRLEKQMTQSALVQQAQSGFGRLQLSGMGDDEVWRVGTEAETATRQDVALASLEDEGSSEQ